MTAAASKRTKTTSNSAPAAAARSFLKPVESLECRVLLSAAAGDLDTLFGGGTVVQSVMSGNDFGYAVAVQSDGKVLVGGTTYAGGLRGNDFALIRLNVDGTLDTSFGGGTGIVVTDMGSTSDNASAIAIQADGKIVLAGQVRRTGTGADFALARFNADGSLDSTFGSGGMTVTDFANGTDQLNAIALTSTGQIVAAGWVSVSGLPQFALARYTTDGQLDASFDGDGKLISAFSGGYSQAFAVTVLGDDSIVAAGTVHQSSTGQPDVAAAHFLSDGSLDSSFGNAGWALVDLGGDTEIAHSVLVQSDGKLVLAAEYSNFSTAVDDFALTRLTSAGLLDTTFGNSGKVFTDFGGDYDQASSAAMEADGKIVVAGTAAVNGVYGFGVAQYNPDGSADTSFASSGKAFIQVGSDATATAVAIDSEHRIVVAGFTPNASFNYDFAVARVIGEVNVPPTAQPGGAYTVDSGGSVQLDGTGSFDPDGQIVSYEWDFNYDGTTFDVDATGATPTFSAATLTGPITQTIALRVTDNSGAVSLIATTTMTVNAVPQPSPFPAPKPVPAPVPLPVPPAHPHRGHVKKLRSATTIDHASSIHQKQLLALESVLTRMKKPSTGLAKKIAALLDA